jgi:hypothetical protein
VFSKILALILTLSLMVRVGSAAQKVAGSAPHGTRTDEVSATENVASRSSSATEKSPEPLTGQEAAALSARAEEPDREVKGGALSNLHLTYAVIALAAIVLVLILK